MIKPSNNKTANLSTITIYSNGSLIDTSFSVISIYLRKAVNQVGSAILVIGLDNMRIAGAPEIESDVFTPGMEIKIAAGYHGDNKVIYEGIVTSNNLQINEVTGPTLHVECRDHIYATTLSRKNNVFKDMKDSEVIKQLLLQYPFSVTVDPTDTTNESSVQYYCSDWDFILSIADANGLIVISSGKSIQVIKPDVDQPGVFTLTYGANILAFNGALDSSAQTTAVDAMAWDAAAQQIISVSGDVPAVNNQGNITPAQLAKVNQQKTILQTTTAKEQTLKSWADAAWLKSAINRFKGTIKFQGTDLAIPGCIIALKGLGTRFDGNAYIGTVEHEIAGGNWYTTATMGISPLNITAEKGVSTAPAADNQLPGTQGLQIGKVVALDNDPTGEDRVQVEIPLLNGNENKIWARLATFWAGQDYGAFFIPDIGEEVVLGFFNDDPRHAVVLGSLYSSNRNAAYALTAQNNIRSLVTRSKMKIAFDEEKKSLTFSTPGNNNIEISDEAKSIKLTDQNGNRIVMSDNGISIDSTKSLIFNAVGGVEINAGTAVDIKAHAEITMKAANIEATAEANFKAKGSATAELSASGVVTVKGAMVMIN